jgi:hypothetical protein
VKYFSQLKIKEYVILIFIVLVVRLWIAFDQEILAIALHRLIAFISIVFSLLLGFYWYTKPKEPILFSTNLSLVLLPIAIVLSIFQHVIFNQDMNLYYKQVLMICGITFLTPYVIGLIFNLLKYRK